MPRERRVVLALAIVHKLAYPHIARALAITEHAVKVHMREALTDIYRDVVAQPVASGSPRPDRTWPPPALADDPQLEVNAPA